METPKKKRTVEHIMETDKRVETVEKYFNQLEFGHRLRLAAETFCDKCIEQGSDATVKVEAKGTNYKFTIKISLDE